MVRYLLGRVGRAGLSLLALTAIVFCVTRLTGDPATTLLPMEATPEQAAALRAAYGLDRPLAVQYGLFLRQMARGDLGTAMYWKRPVTELLGLRIAASAQLAGLAMALAIVVAVPAGVLAAVRRNGRFDRTARIFAVGGASAPVFWVGVMLIELFAVHWRLLPAGGREGAGSLVLPTITLALLISASLLRLTRSSLLEVLDRDYVRLARLKGVPEGQVIWKHAMVNALLPVVTYSAVLLATLLGGAVVTETVFAWPGLGRLLVQAMAFRDFPVIQAVVLLLGTFFVLANLAVDVLYAYLNPRIRYA